jgi:heme/copper-type cytochrome/quinol oxidase subunit 3
MWLFLASDCLLFGALISTYLLYHDRISELELGPKQVFDIPFTSVSSFVLLMSSLTMKSLRGNLTKENAETVEIVGLYWHFVDIVWILIFTIVYLIEVS